MKRRVSFLLMLVLAFALALALSSCGECEHVNVETKREITSSGNCRIADKYDDVTVCTDCGLEISRVSGVGETSDHVPGEPVYENYSVFDCTQGGTCDEVIYCSVAKCGKEISRTTNVKVDPVNAHTIASRWEYDETHTTATVLDVCTKCTNYRVERAPKAGEISAADMPKDGTHKLSPVTNLTMNNGVCYYCSYVMGSETHFKYEDNGDGTKTIIGVKDNFNQENVFIDSSVTAIAEGAFRGATCIKRITMGKNVKTVGKDAFAGCTSIEYIYTYDLISWSQINFANAAANPLSAPRAILSPNKMYDINSSVAFSTVGMTEIGSYAFAGLKANSIFIAAETTVIGEGAFAGSGSLLNVTFHDAETRRSIGADAFADCEKIRNVYASSMTQWLSNSFGSVKANPVRYADSFYLGQFEYKKNAAPLTIPAGTTEISDYAFVSLGFTTVNIPKELVCISAGAFAECRNLTTVAFEANAVVNSINSYAFSGCSSLVSIVLPATVTTIGEGAFESCTALTTVNLDNITAIGSKAFKGCSSLVTVTLPAGLTVLADGIFENCTALTEVNFGAGLEEIGANAFAGCTAITEFTFTANITTIADKAFYGCYNLGQLDLNDGLAVIGKGAFAGCVKVKTIVVPTTVTSIGLGAFEGCVAVESISVPFIGDGATITNFGHIFGAADVWKLDAMENPVELISAAADNNRLFVPLSLKKVIITGNITAIAEDAFKGCDGIVEITLPESLTSIGADAFDGCTGIKVVNFSSIVAWCNINFANYLSNPLFSADKFYIGGQLVTDLVIPDEVTVIKPYAFYGASCITSLVIGNNVVSIGNDAFHGCLALKGVLVSDSLEFVGARAFFGCDEIEAVIITDLEKWCGIEFVDIFANPIYYTEKLYLKDGESVEEIVDLVIPEGVGAISEYAFAGAESIESIDFNDVTEIGKKAFYGCTVLTSLDMGGVTKIGAGAFENCSCVESVILTAVTEIGSRAFANCVAIEGALALPAIVTVGSEAFLNCGAITKAEFGSSLTSIGVSAFYNCKALAEINVPEAVTFIGAHAFAECSLNKVDFAIATGWKVDGDDLDSASITDAKDVAVTLAKAAGKLTELSAYEWTRS